MLHGDRPCRINQDEPQPPEGLPQCPDEASREVREVWEYTLHNLLVMGVATPADRDALLCYCEAVVTHRKASAILAKTAVVIPGLIQGLFIPNPALRVQRESAATVRAFAREFGLTPSARSEIQKTAASGGPAAQRYLNGA